ncbi:MAG: zinc-ribbon domain-containing protein [Firmicutes bacterium]|nr:zinc-ribbon domain-containing protein [Bacillota bacterium]
MKYCSNCGKELADHMAYCPECGTAQQAVPQQPVYQQAPQQPYQAPRAQAPVDTGSIGWAFLGFFFPVVGLILFLVWKDQKPLTSKKAGLGALIGVISSVVLSVIYVIIVMFAAAAYFPY